MNIHESIAELVGNTPLVRLGRVERALGLEARLAAKLESCNPLGSVKDRAALAMVEQAERDGLLQPGGLIVEPTSGNTGVGLAMACTLRGYKLVLTMPEGLSAERQALLRALGAELVLTDRSLGMPGAIAEAGRLCAEKNAYMPMQFENPANPRAHYESTGPELWRDTDGKLDMLICTFGTGGTLTGTGRYLKEQNPNIQVIGVEPAGSAVVSGGAPGPHKIQGLGAGFVPKVLDLELMDEVIAVSDDDAYAATRLLAAQEGILAGVSSGAALHAAIALAARQENKGKLLALLLPDTGERYLSTDLFA